MSKNPVIPVTAARSAFIYADPIGDRGSVSVCHLAGQIGVSCPGATKSFQVGLEVGQIGASGDVATGPDLTDLETYLK